MNNQSQSLKMQGVEEAIREFADDDWCGVCFVKELNQKMDIHQIDLQDIIYVLNFFIRVSPADSNGSYFVFGETLDGIEIQIDIVLSMQFQRIKVIDARRLDYGESTHTRYSGGR